MNIEAINDFYLVSKENGYEGSVNDYFQELNNNPVFLENEYNNSLKYGYQDSINDFANLLGVSTEELKKKSSDLNLPLEGGPSLLDSTPTENTQPNPIQNNPLVDQPKPTTPISNEIAGEQPIQETISEQAVLDQEGPKPKKKNVYTVDTIISGSMGKDIFGEEFSKEDYNKWARQQVDLGNAEFVIDFGKKEKGKPSIGLPKMSEDTFVIKPTEKGLEYFNSFLEKKEPTEEDFFKGGFGDALRSIDDFTNLGFGDFVDDLGRSAYEGYKQSGLSEAANTLIFKGKSATPEEIENYIKANQDIMSLGQSAEMQEYQKIYEEEGKGFWGVIKGIAKNPTIVPQLILSSLVSMATNKQAVVGGLGAIATGAATGAAAGGAVGSIIPGAGTAVGGGAGAIAGAEAALPYAFGVASGIVESGATFSELLQEELKGKPLTKENVKLILEDPEKFTSIRNKAIARGIVIGTVDALTGKLSKAVGAKTIPKGVGRATLATTIVEAAGGAGGEALAQGIVDEKFDASNIALEGISEIGMATPTIIQSVVKAPSVKVNGQKTSVQQLNELIDTMTPEQLYSTKIEIKNDSEGLQKKIQDKIVKGEIKKQIKEASPELNEASIDAITDLEEQLRNLEGNNTQVAKDKASAIRQQIKEIQANPIQEPITETTTTEKVDLNAKRGEDVFTTETTTTIKPQEDAIQKQATDESVLRSEQSKVELPRVGEGDAKPKEVTEQKETITPEEQEIERRRQEELNNKQKFASSKKQSDKEGIPYKQIGIDEIDLESSGLEGIDGVKKVIVIEERGLNADGKKVGTVRIVTENGAETFEVFFNNDKINEKYDAELEALKSKQKETITPEGKEEVTDYKEISKKILDDKELNTVRASLRRSSPDSFSLQVLDSIAKKEPADTGDFELDQKIDDAIENGVSINTIANLILQDEDLVDNKGIDSKRKAIDYVLNIGEKGTLIKAAQKAITPEITLEEALNLDTNETSNFDKVISFLDNAITKLDSFEKETLGINIPVVLAKKVFEAVKVTFKATKNLSEAIKKVANEFKLSEKDVKEAVDYFSTTKKEDKKITPSSIEKSLKPPINKVEVNEKTALKDQIRLESKAAREGQKSVSDAVKAITKYFNDLKSRGNITRADMSKVIREISKVKDQRTLDIAADKIFNIVSNAKTDIIEVSESKALRDQIKSAAKNTKDTAKAFVKASKGVSERVDDLVKKGNITPKQAAAVVARFSKVNVFSDSSVDRFLNYAEKVFNNADYAEKISNINAKIKRAKSNIESKIGVGKGIRDGIEKLLTIKPTLIPDKVFDKYSNVVNKFGDSSAVLPLEEKAKVFDDVWNILDAVNKEESLVPQLDVILSYSESKVFDKDGKLNYSETINNMVKNNEISSEDAEIMKKYKSDIYPSKDREGKSDAQIEEEKNNTINAIESYDLDSSQFFLRDERDDVKRLNKLIKDPDIDLRSFDPIFLKNLEKTLDNIQNGYFSHFAQLAIEKLNASKNSSRLEEALGKIKYSVLDKILMFPSVVFNKGGMPEVQLERNPKLGIDEAFGNYNTKEIWESVFEPTARQDSNLNTEVNLKNEKIDKAREAISKSYNNNPNKVLQSSFKISAYLDQLSFESNPNSKSVNPAVDYIDATIKEIKGLKTKYGRSKTEIKWLEDLKEKYVVDGQLDAKKLYESFNPAEKNAVKVIQEQLKSVEDKAEYTANVKRGEPFKRIENYNRVEVLKTSKPGEKTASESIIDQKNNLYKPSTKSSTLKERTPGAKPKDFDVFASTKKAIRETLTDYYLTEPVRTARKTLSETRDKLMEKGASEKEIMAFNAIEKAYESTLDGVLSNSFTTSGLADDISSLIGRNAVKMALVGTYKFTAETLGNIAGVLINDPKAFFKGITYTDIMYSDMGVNIMKNVKSIKTNDLYNAEELSGKFVDAGSISKPKGISGGKAQPELINRAIQAWNYSGKPISNVFNIISDKSVSTPDRATTLPMWYGKFANEFQKLTGKELTREDFKKIADNDEVFMNKYEDVIKEATKKADDRAVQTAPPKNAWTGLVNKTNKKNEGKTLPAKLFYAFKDEISNFMISFQIYEFLNARKGIVNAINSKAMTKREGAALLTASIVKMMVYSLAIKELMDLSASLISKALDIPEEDEEEKEKTFTQRLSQNFLSTTLSLFFGRNFGNLTRFGMNSAIEWFNKNYGQALREGEYDPYDDSLAWSVIPLTKEAQKSFDFEDVVAALSGKYSQPLKTVIGSFKDNFAEEPKDEAARITLERKKNIKYPLEFFALGTGIPGYKDIKPVVSNYVYEELKKQNKIKEQEDKEDVKTLQDLKKEYSDDKEFLNAIDIKIKLLSGTEKEKEEAQDYENEMDKMKNKLLVDKDKNYTYDSKSDLEKYNPDLYEKNFGEESEYYKKYGAYIELTKELNKIKREAKDAKHGYKKGSRKKSSVFGKGGFSGGGFGGGGFTGGGF